ncbi:MAG: hypothetical protein EOO41_05805, partial [Methanobacteriota archaeon]
MADDACEAVIEDGVPPRPTSAPRAVLHEQGGDDLIPTGEQPLREMLHARSAAAGAPASAALRSKMPGGMAGGAASSLAARAAVANAAASARATPVTLSFDEVNAFHARAAR